MPDNPLMPIPGLGVQDVAMVQRGQHQRAATAFPVATAPVTRVAAD